MLTFIYVRILLKYICVRILKRTYARTYALGQWILLRGDWLKTRHDEPIGQRYIVFGKF